MNNLSSRLTIFYKVIFPAVWTSLIVAFVAFILWNSHNALALLILLMILPMLGPIQLKWIKFDDHHVFISNGFKNWTYTLQQVKALNEPGGVFDSFFELEIRTSDGSVIKFDFLPKLQDNLTYRIGRKYSGSLREFDKRVRAAKSVESV